MQQDKGQKNARFYSSKLFTQLQSRMLELIGQDNNDIFRDYQRHLEMLGINLHRYLIPGVEDAFGLAIKGENLSIKRTAIQLDEIILRLINAQEEAWAQAKEVWSIRP